MASKTPPNGIWVPVPTFFVPKTSSAYVAGRQPLDLETQAAHSVFLAKAGIRGIVLLGSTGESVAVTNEERAGLIRHVRDSLAFAGFTDYPLMAGTATQGFEDTIEQLRMSAAAGAQWGMCLAPGYFAAQASPAGIAQWFEALANASPIPILVYHYPGVSNALKIPPSVFEQLSKHPNIVGCKLSHFDLSTTTQIALSTGGSGESSKFKTFTGLGQQLLPVLSVDGAGAIDALSAIFPRTVVKIFDLWSKGNLADPATLTAIREIQLEVSRGEELFVKYGVVGVKAAAQRILGMGEADGTRYPMTGGLSDMQWQEFDDVFKRLTVFEQKLAQS